MVVSSITPNTLHVVTPSPPINFGRSFKQHNHTFNKQSNINGTWEPDVQVSQESCEMPELANVVFDYYDTSVCRHGCVIKYFMV